MKWPFMLVSTHDRLVMGNRDMIGLLQTINKERNREMDRLAVENSELREKLERQSVIITPEAKVYRTKKEYVTRPAGRMGWRQQSQAASMATIPAPSDSIQALEARVKAEGGTVDAVPERKV